MFRIIRRINKVNRAFTSILSVIVFILIGCLMVSLSAQFIGQSIAKYIKHQEVKINILIVTTKDNSRKVIADAVKKLPGDKVVKIVENYTKSNNFSIIITDNKQLIEELQLQNALTSLEPGIITTFTNDAIKSNNISTKISSSGNYIELNMPNIQQYQYNKSFFLAVSVGLSETVRYLQMDTIVKLIALLQ